MAACWGWSRQANLRRGAKSAYLMVGDSHSLLKEQVVGLITKDHLVLSADRGDCMAEAGTCRLELGSKWA
eukprot:11009057-Prorocentrum_lima.AAC.1